MTVPATAVRQPWEDQTLRILVVRIALVVGAVVGGVIVGQAAMSAQTFVVLVPAVPLLVIAMWKRPWLTLLLAVGAALLFEQFSYTVGTHDGPFTAHVPIFRSFGGGVVLLPIEVLLIMGLLIWLLRAGLMRTLNLPGSAISKTS